MKSLTLPITFLLSALCWSSFARLNESLEECKARYGNLMAGGSDSYGALANGFVISLSFKDNKCYSIVYIKAESMNGGLPLPISEPEIKTLLSNNFGASSFTEEKPHPLIFKFIAPDGGFGQYDSMRRHLTLVSKEGISITSENMQSEAARNLDGL